VYPVLIIRSAAPEDDISVTALWRACDLATHYNDPIKDFHFALSQSNSDVLVGESADAKIIGSVMVEHDGHRGWIYYVAADPDFRKQGIGSKMVEAAEQWLQKRNIVKVMLLVRETNTQIIDFYNHIGFESIPRIVMQKWLQSKE